MAEQFGTELIEKTFDVLIEIGQGVEKRLADDGKINIPEAISLAVETFPDIYNVARNAKDLVAEFKDWSVEERELVLAKVAVKFDLENDKVEAMIEDGLALLVAISAYIKHFRK
jgi:urease gamma subunit